MKREVTLRTHLGAGFHLLVPSTFLQGAEASFLRRVFSSAPVSLSALKSPRPPRPRRSRTGSGRPAASRAGGSRGFRRGGAGTSRPTRTNPHVPLAVSYRSSEPNTRITLRQHCPAKALQPIGFHIYQVPEGSVEPQISQDQELRRAACPTATPLRCACTAALAPGAYVILPSTYQPQCKGHFTLTVAQKIHRKVVRARRALGQIIQEVSNISVMSS
ncbi:hypothetical protein SKAU_G00202410 [Synaphobranchus kaupii]|uniref:Peptidase C2 calpain domain-containing protein n=1 Tax=Synaphobranchus kaupii TaxID=118154 RepID=A0A9Q1FFQ8_SYNKA|nr:hypothetical protein SKAU_G00202410 [Synaphobranchus kaupii]